MSHQEMLHGATGISIKKSRISNTIVEKRAKIHRGLPELSEFTEVKRGDIYKHGNVCYSWRLCSNGKDDTEAAVYHAEINIVGPFGQKKFTVKTYHGQNGKKEWRRDFLRCSRDWHGDIPLFGYNMSSVPLLIFYGELVPLAHIEAQVGDAGRVYFGMLKNTLGCLRNEIWMDPTKGTFCCEPVGLKCIEWSDYLDVGTIPLDVEFLKEDVVIRYFSTIKHDRGLIRALDTSSDFEHLKDVPSISYFHVISRLTNSIIAFNWNVRWWVERLSS
ncbi:hypothetical protein L218DRAFT_1006184 [Marasmius fiardii PR-910]|nr:hypothetical protein L218DRAFT_1006184 [Marasmius fiardii PR-910]